jgi:glucose-6-phosphate isomerase
MNRIILDYNNMLQSAVGDHGIAAADVHALSQKFADSHARLAQSPAIEELGFMRLPAETAVVEQIRSFADGVGQAFDTIVVLGIGGSALGASALLQALRPPHWNELDDDAREYFPRLFILDNIDPTTVGPLLDRLDMRRTLFNVISKSGATAETMAQYQIVRDRLQSVMDEDAARGHLIFTTDPVNGVLRKIADSEGIATLPVPPDVGGRFSVLSAVGLLPAALIGIDIAELLRGAADMAERCSTDVLSQNPAGIFAALQYLAQTQRGANVHVMMPYTDRLYGMADWFRQLWAESLGKKLDRDGNEVFVGGTPVKALGVTDQHSQVQLYMEGPFDKTITFLTVADPGTDVQIPKLYDGVEALAYLGGASLGALLNAEQNATAAALTTNGRMNMEIRLQKIDAHAVGQLIMLLQIATVYAGALYNVNPLDQPGVELGKKLTYGLMGRPGFDRPSAISHDEQWVMH